MIEGDAADLQRQTLLIFSGIFAASGSCRRKLLLCSDGGQFACAAALAVLGLGGCCLLVAQDALLLRAAGQTGPADFAVSEVTEALRILKTELRKGLPISVGLATEPQTAIAEMLRRGVQPDLVCTPIDELGSTRAFEELGASNISLPSELVPGLQSAFISVDTASSRAERKARDRHLFDDLMDGAPDVTDLVGRVNAKWLVAAPRLFPRDRTRLLWSRE